MARSSRSTLSTVSSMSELQTSEYVRSVESAARWFSRPSRRHGLSHAPHSEHVDIIGGSFFEINKWASGYKPWLGYTCDNRQQIKDVLEVPSAHSPTILKLAQTRIHAESKYLVFAMSLIVFYHKKRFLCLRCTLIYLVGWHNKINVFDATIFECGLV